MNIFHHTGDLGDCVAALPVIRELGGGRLIFSDSNYPPGQGPRESMRGKRFESFQSLTEAAPYVSSIEWQDDPVGITHDLARFRSMHWVPTESLITWQARFFNLMLPLAPEPWLTVDAEKHGRIVVGRTARYHTTYFPWRLIVDDYGDDILFVGLPAEHQDFQIQARRKIDYAPTANLFEAAKIIAGSRLFIGNQSVMFWMAAGLGHPLIQETHHEIYTRNSYVPRGNALYCRTTEELTRVYDELKLDKEWIKKHPIPVRSRVNLSTSGGDPRKNLSTSAEIYELLRE
jgi:hypothetical protein